MAIDPALPKDPAGAQELLAKLALKDQNEALCRYPGCDHPRKPSENGGMPPAYCENAMHTAQRNFRARAYLEDLAKGLSPATIETEQPVTARMIQSLRDTAL